MFFYFFGSGRDQKKICNSTRLLVNRRVIRSTTSVLLGTLSSWWVDCINKCQTESAGLSSKQIYCFWSKESVCASYGICIPWLEQSARWICNLWILISCDSKCLVFLAFFHFFISVNQFEILCKGGLCFNCYWKIYIFVRYIDMKLRRAILFFKQSFM